jgi:hypothetical protein
MKRLFSVVCWAFVALNALAGLDNLIFQPPVPGVMIGLSCLMTAALLATVTASNGLMDQRAKKAQPKE